MKRIIVLSLEIAAIFLSAQAFSAPSVSLSGVSGIHAYGDSYTVGYYATNYNGYIYQFAQAHNLALTNNGVSGGTSGNVIQRFYASDSTLSPAMTTILIGLNDLRGSATSPQASIEAVKGVLRSVIADKFSNFAVPSYALSLNGFSTRYTGATYRFGTVQISSHAGEYMSWLFNGDSLVVGYQTSPYASNSGQFDITVDGMVKKIVDPRGQTDGQLPLMPNAVILTGLGSGRHSLFITAIDNNSVWIDWVGTLKNPSECPPIAIWDVAHLSTQGYQDFRGSQGPLSDSVIDSLNLGIASVVSQFSGYPVVEVPTNSYVNPSTDYSTSPDTYHWNDIGHADAKLAGDSVVQ